MDIKNVIAPDVDKRKELRTSLNNNAYYIIIVLITLLVIFVPPLCIGCLQGDVGLQFPKSLEGWILWGVVNGSTAIGNASLLILFKLQAKKNSRSHPNYIKANDILNKLNGTGAVFVPRSPKEMNMKDYSMKIISIILSTVMASITLTSIIINFDWVSLISCLISSIIALVVSWMTMLNNEEYWTEEYLLYAQMIEQKLKESSKKDEELLQNKEANNA